MSKHFSDPIHAGVPGILKIAIEIFDKDDPSYQMVLPDGSVSRKGMSLAEARLILGGDEGEMIDPVWGEKHRISLMPWKEADPDQTYISIQFRFKPDHPISNPLS